MEFLQNIEGERAGHAKGEVVDEHSISTLVSAHSIHIEPLAQVDFFPNEMIALVERMQRMNYGITTIITFPRS